MRKDEQVYVTNISNQTKKMKGDISYHAYSSADIYITQDMFDVNPCSKIFKRAAAQTPGAVLSYKDTEGENDEWTRFRMATCKRWIVVKIALPGHYAAALIDQRLKRVEFFDSGGIHEDWIIRRVRELFAATLPTFRLNIVQTEMLQLDEMDGYCQTWIWVWLYFRLVKKYSHMQFKRLFQKMGEKERTECMREAHYFLIG